jgi:uncharacterized membrane protein YbhN (UPF0104 family)
MGGAAGVSRLGVRLRLAATLLATVAVLWVLMRRFGGGSALASVARGASPAWVGLSFLAACACVALGTERWRRVLVAMGYAVPYGRALVAVLASWPLALVTPSRANDLLRPLAVRDVVPLAPATGSVLAEKAIDLGVLLLFSAAGAAVGGLWGWAAAVGALCVAEIAAVWLVVTRRGWLEQWPLLRGRRAAIDELFGAFVALGRAPLQLAALGAVSLLIRVLTVGVTHALLLSVGAQVRLVDTMTMWPVATLVGIAPLTLGGMGTRDAAFLHLLAERGAHAEPAQILAATVGYSAVAIASFALAGLPFMIRETLRLRR